MFHLFRLITTIDLYPLFVFHPHSSHHRVAHGTHVAKSQIYITIDAFLHSIFSRSCSLFIKYIRVCHHASLPLTGFSNVSAFVC